MNVLKIVVDGDLPIRCADCDIPFRLCTNKVSMTLNRTALLEMETRPTWCPLVVEVPEVCEWKKGKNPSLYFNPHIETMGYLASAKDDLKFCHDCGKPIKYIESE